MAKMGPSGRTVVDTAGTPVSLGPPMRVKFVHLSRIPGDTNDVYVGAPPNIMAARYRHNSFSGVSAVSGSEAGFRLEPDRQYNVDADDLTDIWIDAKTNGEGVTWQIYV